MFCKIKFHFSPKRDWRADKTVIFFLNFKMTAGQLVERLPPSKSCTVTGMAPKRCGSVFFFFFFFSSRRKRPALIGPFDTSKRKMSAAFDRCDWQSVLVKSKNLLSKHLLDQVKRRLSCFSCVPAVYFKMASRNGSLTHVPLNPSPAISLRHSSSSPPSIRARLAPAPQASQPLSFSISRILDLEDDSIQRQTDPPLGKYSC